MAATNAWSTFGDQAGSTLSLAETDAGITGASAAVLTPHRTGRL